MSALEVGRTVRSLGEVSLGRASLPFELLHDAVSLLLSIDESDAPGLTPPEAVRAWMEQLRDMLETRIEGTDD